jgi:urease accessory protein
MPRSEIRPLISTGLQPGVGATKEGSAVLTALRAGVETAEAVRVSVAIPNTRLKPGANERCSDFLLWQLADSAFPTGGFAHSAGLEAAWQHGEVRNRNELLSFAEASLHQLGRAALPFVSAAHEEPLRLEELDGLCDAFTSNHVANRASRAQGRAFLSAVERIFKVGQASSQSGRNNDACKAATLMAPAGTGRMPALPCAHLAPVFGACFRWLEVPRETTLRLFVFNFLRSLIAAAIRLNIVGPMEAQSLQHDLSSPAEEVLQRSLHLTLDDLAQTAPLLDLWQGAQDRLYSRLFQS